MKDYSEIVRRSMRQDFANANYKRNARIPKTHRPKDARRVVDLTDMSEYARFRRFIVGKLVRIVDQGLNGCWVEFIRDVDRDALNRAAGWNDKRRFLLDGAKFD